MLVLTRKVGETVVIGDNIILTVVLIDNGKVRLGVTAPPAIRVDRSEVHDRRLHQLPEEDLAVSAVPKPTRPGFKRSRLVK